MGDLQGKKFDTNKPRMSLLPKGALNAVIRVLEFGATKYQENNWKHVPDAKTRYYDAMQRHIDAWWNGERKDQETGEHHLAHAICCGMFLIWFDHMDEEAAIKEMDEVIKMQDTDLRKHEKQIENLKAQLNNMEQCYIEKKKQVEELQGQLNKHSECIENLVNQKADYLDRVTKAIAHLDSFDLSQAGMNKLQRSIESALEALRGEHE